MPKYEIMIILDPKADVKIAQTLTSDVFGSDVKKFDKLDRTELAYPINGSTTATYLLLEVQTDGQNISEFTRKARIQKAIWRQLVINLDEEKANRIAKPKKIFDKPKRTFEDSERKPYDENRRSYEGQPRRPFDPNRKFTPRENFMPRENKDTVRK